MSEPICDIVLLTWNRPELLIPCVESILRHTDIPCRLILVDNASTDPKAVEFLENLRGTERVRLELVRRAHNDGFSIGINDGLSRTTAPWVCILNNDVLVTEGWLGEMIRVAENNPDIGLLNPMSNEFGAYPPKPGAVDEAAAHLRNRAGQWTEFWTAVGFCMLIPRQILEKVGLLDQKFRFIYFEDADYAMRVRRAGFRCGIAKGSYVYHLGSGTMNHNPEKLRMFEENRRLFLQKWNLPASQRVAWALPFKSRPEEMEDLRGRIRFFANQDHTLWIFCTKETAPFVPEHLNVRALVHSKISFYAVALWMICFKKKRFQKILLGLQKGTAERILSS